MENDRKEPKSRNDFSHSALRESVRLNLLKLMKKKEYDKITIKELCEASGVSRTGFYRNFSSKDDVVSEIARWQVEEIVSYAGVYFNCPVSKRYGWYLDYFRYIKENGTLYSILFKAKFQYSYTEMINALLIEMSANKDPEEVAGRILWNGALTNLSIQWIRDGLKNEPEQLARMCMLYLEKKIPFTKS